MEVYFLELEILINCSRQHFTNFSSRVPNHCFYAFHFCFLKPRNRPHSKRFHLSWLHHSRLNFLPPDALLFVMLIVISKSTRPQKCYGPSSTGLCNQTFSTRPLFRKSNKLNKKMQKWGFHWCGRSLCIASDLFTAKNHIFPILSDQSIYLCTA